MPFLIDCFSPAEMLHMVSIANRHQLLTTDQKRFLIGLRMAEVSIDGTYKISSEKIGKFNRIFGQFLNELKTGQCCDKDECPTCDRLQDLLTDFHGPQESPEFQRFIDWFQKSTLVYSPSESEAPAKPAPVLRGPASAGGSPRPASMLSSRPVCPPPIEADAPSVVPSLPASALTGPFEDAPARRPVQAATPPQASAPSAPPVSVVRPEIVPEPPAPEPAPFPAFPEHDDAEPLFRPNENHPLVRQLVRLSAAPLNDLGEHALREHALQLQQTSRRLLSSLGIKPVSETTEPGSSVTA